MSTVRKAIAAFVGTFGTGLVTAALVDGIEANEWYGIIGGALAAGALVYYTPNAEA